MILANSRPLLDCLAAHARTRPGSIALVMGRDRITYGELQAMACSAFTQIEALDLPPDGRVAVHAAKSPRTIALIIACMMGHRPFLLPSAELGANSYDALLERAGCKDILAADPVGKMTGHRIHDIHCAPAGGSAAHGRGVPKRRAADAISFMLTTSGSTGLPKIVPLPAGAIDRFTDWAAARFHIEPGTVVLNYAPLNFDLCLLDIWATLRAGGTALLVNPARATHGSYLAGLVRSAHVVQSVPMLYRLLAEAHDGQPFAGVKHVILTGDKVPAGLLAQFPGLFPGARIYNLYGCTETNDSFLHELPDGFEPEADVPIGRPLPGVDAVIVDKHGATVDGPGSGELLVHTPFQAAAYLDPAASASAFVLRDGCGERRYFRSGDLVRRDENGIFTLLGRNDFQIKVRGTRVNLQEVEHVFLDHGRVLEVAVVGVPDDIAGRLIHAVVRGREPGVLDSLTLREHCRYRLPRAAIPATIHVVDGPLPTTSTGKIDRQAISNVLKRSGRWTTRSQSNSSSSASSRQISR